MTTIHAKLDGDDFITADGLHQGADLGFGIRKILVDVAELACHIFCSSESVYEIPGDVGWCFDHRDNIIQ